MGRGLSDEKQTSETADGDPTVLIVEDEDRVAELYTKILSRNYNVLRASTGGEALMQLDETVDVVLLDRRMPGMSGDEALEQIRAQDVDVRVAMVSAVEPDFDVIDMGFDDYLVKPTENQVLEETVERLLALEEYADLYRELSSKSVKQNILEVEKSRAKLEESAEYQHITDRIEELEAKLDEIDSEQEFDDRLLPS
jgi:two-component system response regulator AdeR